MEESTRVPSKRCTGCGEVKPLTEYTMHNYKKRKPSRRSKCRDCNAAYLAEWSRERREFLDHYKISRGCVECGYREHVAALEFDHLPQFEKVADISQFRFRGSEQELQDELAKCEVVCANCHRVRTMDRNDSGRSRGSDLRGKAVVILGLLHEDPHQLCIDLDEIA